MLDFRIYKNNRTRYDLKIRHFTKKPCQKYLVCFVVDLLCVTLGWNWFITVVYLALLTSTQRIKLNLNKLRTKAFIFITGKEKTITNIQFLEKKISLHFPFSKVMLKLYKDCNEVNTYWLNLNHFHER